MHTSLAGWIASRRGPPYCCARICIMYVQYVYVIMNAYIYIIYNAYVIMNQESLLVIVLLDESVPMYVYSTLCLHRHMFMYCMSVKLIHCHAVLALYAHIVSASLFR